MVANFIKNEISYLKDALRSLCFCNKSTYIIIVCLFAFTFGFYFNPSLFKIREAQKIRPFVGRSVLDTALSVETYEFIKIHNRNVLKQTNKMHVVFYKVQGYGYGNRMYSMMTAFFVALLTDSALLIDWPYIDQYFETPLQFAFTKFNDSSSLDLNQTMPKLCNALGSSNNSWAYEKKLILNARITREKLKKCSRYFKRY